MKIAINRLVGPKGRLGQQGPRIAPVCVMTLLFCAVLSQKLIAQCVEHPDKMTALKFSNESRFELTFFVDEDEQGVVVPARTISDEINVEAGEHLLRARTIVRGESFWVWVINEVPQGHLCTWTITDPPKTSDSVNSRFKMLFTEKPAKQYVAVTAQTERSNF